VRNKLENTFIVLFATLIEYCMLFFLGRRPSILYSLEILAINMVIVFIGRLKPENKNTQASKIKFIAVLFIDLLICIFIVGATITVIDITNNIGIYVLINTIIFTYVLLGNVSFRTLGMHILKMDFVCTENNSIITRNMRMIVLNVFPFLGLFGTYSFIQSAQSIQTEIFKYVFSVIFVIDIVIFIISKRTQELAMKIFKFELLQK
jgi:hypothetical protein